VPSRPGRARSGSASNSIGEAYRVVRSNLMITLGDLERPTVLVTSAVAGEGKTATCSGLARSLAQAGQRVVVVDLDLRHPDVHNWLRGHNERGVTDILLGDHTLEECLQQIRVGQSANRPPRSLYLLSTGRIVDNPSELLGTRRTADLLDTLSAQADVVLIDTPPVLPVADTRVIGRITAGAILVIESGRTPAPTVERAKAALIGSQTRILGVVLNKQAPKDAEYGYGYGYGQVDDEPPEVQEAASEG
jgi:capsular exopolysaccharide synthesis family protein